MSVTKASGTGSSSLKSTQRQTFAEFLAQKEPEGAKKRFEMIIHPYQETTRIVKGWINNEYFPSLRQSSTFGEIFGDFQPHAVGEAKTFKSVYLKVYVNELEDRNEAIEKLTDLARARIVVPYLSQVEFLGDDLITDFLGKIKYCNVLNQGTLQQYLQHRKESGYRSMHADMFVPVKMSGDRTARRVRFELQIRTQLEDAWAEREHKLIFKNYELLGFLRGEAKETPPEQQLLRSTMVRCSDLLHSVDELFDEVRLEIERQLAQRRKGKGDAGTISSY